ncbi:MAG TPA: FCD domain-containing protein [Anaerolineales bacterium]|nr:FCD domain-containing protein [Anaerolineales bacterium]
MARKRATNEFIEYLLAHPVIEGDRLRLPPLNDLSRQLGMSVSTLREQMEAARALGLVEARPRTGVRRLPYSFLPAVSESLSYAIALDQDYFQKYADLRQKIETAYWYEAVQLLTDEDHIRLRALVNRAWEKLRGSPIQIPQGEHREMHLLIYRRLNNPFVLGLLEAHWDAYEAVGLNLYADYFYLEEVWGYHQRMVDGILTGDLEAGYQALLEHTDLLHHRAIQQESGVTLIKNGLE